MTTSANTSITLVSGFPRSGTSLLMQMLAAAGNTILSDDVRKADDSNPRGYFEFEAVKRIAQDQSWIEQARGRVVKVVTPLLLNLPQGETYQVIILHRDWSEILASQAKMRALAEPGFSMNAKMERILIETFRKQEKRALGYLEDHLNATVLHLEHRDLILKPEAAAVSVADFLKQNFDPLAFASVVRPELYRNRLEGL